VTKDEIAALYDEMETLTVGLTLAPELGPDYLKEKISECRQKQNRALTLFLRLSREASTLRLRLQAAREAVRIAGASPQAQEFRRQVADLTDEFESARYAFGVLKVVRSNLIRTQTEIRTLSDIITGKSGERRGMSDHIPDLPPGANTGTVPVSPEQSMREAMTPDAPEEEDGLDEDSAAIEEVFAGLPEPEPAAVQPLTVSAEVEPLTVGPKTPDAADVPQAEAEAFFGGEVTTPPPAATGKAKKLGGDDIDIDSLLGKE
jgi:hypothetical protein